MKEKEDKTKSSRLQIRVNRGDEVVSYINELRHVFLWSNPLVLIIFHFNLITFT